MKKFLLSLAAVGLTLLAAARSPAQDDTKPIVVLSLPSADALLKNIAYLGAATGNADQKKVEDVIKEAGGLKGLDRSKPIGLALTIGTPVQFLGFMPVSDVVYSLAFSFVTF